MPKSTSAYAAEGTAAHELGEMCLRSGNNAADHIGAVMTVQGTAFEVTEEMAEAVQVYLDTVRADLAAVGKGAVFMIENKFRLDWLYPGLFGTNDALVGEPFGVLKIFDYKHGVGVAVEVEDNTQMMYYALGGAKGETYEDVELVVVQPRAPHSDGRVRRQRMPIEELMRWAQEVLLPGAKATEDPSAPLDTGDHCRFCPALAVCPLQKERAMTIAAEVFAPVPSAPPSPEAIPYEKLRQILDKADLIEAWLKACREHVKALLETGKASAEEVGYKLVPGRASRKWVDDKEAETWLEAMLGDEAYVPRKLVSVAQAEKVLKGPAKKALAEMISEVRGVSMVPISDKREALAPSATTAFEEVEV
jgi:hypothetical protein